MPITQRAPASIPGSVSNLPRFSAGLSHRSRMHVCTPKVGLLVTFLVSYMVITLYIAKLQHNCPALAEMAVRSRDIKESDTLAKAHVVDNIHLTRTNSSGLVVAKTGIPAGKLLNGVQDIVLAPLGQPIPFQAAKASEKPPTPKPTAYRIEAHQPHELLDPYYAPNTVFYVWCGRRWFEFNHYLSVMSVIRELRPDNIIFYYDTYPVMDSWSYNTWFDELRNDYPFFRHRQLDKQENGCLGHSTINPTFVFDKLTQRGGMFVHENTLIDSFPVLYRNYSIVHALNESSMEGLLMSKRGFPGQPSDMAKYIGLNAPTIPVKSFQCGTPTQYVRANRKPNCVLAKLTFFPKDIWELDQSFGRLTRRIFYGRPEIRLPEQNFDELIPNIAHVVWLGGGEMDFLFYLCMLSLVYVAEVDMVYLHGDGPPTGQYWQRIKLHPKIKLVYRETPQTVYGNTVNVLSHVTDIWRVDFMVKYGGIYVDTDTAFVKPLDRDIRAYDAVGSYDWTYWNHPFPDTINFGVAIGKRNAIYWQEFQKSMKWFMDKDWSWNGLRQPYRIKERHPEMVKIDPRLQVICYESKCHPTWYQDYHDEGVHHLNKNPIKDWRKDVYAFHWTLPTPVELLSEENLMKNNTMFSEIGKYILEKAGLLDDLKARIKH